MALRTSLSIRYISDIVRKSARDARAFQKLEKVGTYSLKKLRMSTRGFAKELRGMTGKLSGLGGAGAAATAGALAFDSITFNRGFVQAMNEAGVFDPAERAKIKQEMIDVANEFHMSKDRVLTDFREGMGLIGDFTTALNAVVFGSAFAAAFDLDSSTLAYLANELKLGGAKTKEDFEEGFSTILVAGRKGQLVASARARIASEVSAAFRQIGITDLRQSEPLLQAGAGGAGSPDKLKEQIVNLITQMQIWGMQNFRDEKGGFIGFDKSLEKITNRYDNDKQKIFNSKDGIEKNVKILLANSLSKEFKAIYNRVDKAVAGDNRGEAVKSALDVGDTVASRAENLPTYLVDLLGKASDPRNSRLSDLTGADITPLMPSRQTGQDYLDSLKNQPTEINITLHNAPRGTSIRSTQTTGIDYTKTNIVTDVQLGVVGSVP